MKTNTLFNVFLSVFHKLIHFHINKYVAVLTSASITINGLIGCKNCWKQPSKHKKWCLLILCPHLEIFTLNTCHLGPRRHFQRIWNFHRHGKTVLCVLSSVKFNKVLRIDLVAVKYYEDFRVHHVIHAAVKEVGNARVFRRWSAVLWVTHCVFPN